MQLIEKSFSDKWRNAAVALLGNASSVGIFEKDILIAENT